MYVLDEEELASTYIHTHACLFSSHSLDRGRHNLHLSSHTELMQVLPGHPQTDSQADSKKYIKQLLLLRSSEAIRVHHNIVQQNTQNA